MHRRSKTHNHQKLRSELDFFIDFYEIASLKDSDPLAHAIWESFITGVGISDDEMQKLLKNRKFIDEKTKEIAKQNRNEKAIST